jgi:hypothetical protein
MILLSKAFVGVSCCLLMLANKREAAWTFQATPPHLSQQPSMALFDSNSHKRLNAILYDIRCVAL